MQAQSKLEFNLDEYISLIKEVTQSGGEFRLFPKGTSMMPLLRQGRDSVGLVELPIKLKKHDIILYKRKNGQFVLHRIIKINNNGELLLCGDNQTNIESDIYQDDVLALVSCVYRGEKRYDVTKKRMKIYETVWCFMPFRKTVFFFRKFCVKVRNFCVRSTKGNSAK